MGRENVNFGPKQTLNLESNLAGHELDNDLDSSKCSLDKESR